MVSTSVIWRKKILSKHRPTVARVDLDAIAFNVQQVSDHIQGEALKYAVVKASAWGHGVVATKLAPQVDSFCVSIWMKPSKSVKNATPYFNFGSCAK